MLQENMRIAYIAIESASRETGVLKKILSQAKEWRRQGAESHVFILTHDTNTWHGLNQDFVSTFAYTSFLGRFLSATTLTRSIKEWGPDLIYFRFGTLYPAILKLSYSLPLVLEINSDVLKERKAVMAFPKFAILRALHDMIIRKSKGVVTVARPIARNYTAYAVPTITIGNSIELAAFDTLPPASNQTPRIVFIGTPNCPWHGVDKVIRMASAFPKWHFDIVGLEARDIGADVPGNVSLHGYLPREEYEAVLARADVGIGSLALHRIGMEETSPLKVREYLAYGLPIINGCQDPDVPDNWRYVLILPNSECNVDESIPAIEKFVDGMMGVRVPRQEVAHLDVGVKERERLTFMKSVLAS